MIDATAYIQRYKVFPMQIKAPPRAGMGIVVVIPVFNEPDLLPTLDSLANCVAPDCGVEIILVINSSETCSSEIRKQNRISQAQVQDFIRRHPDLLIYSIDQQNLPVRHAGVGWARKIGMDEAVRRFSAIGQDGVIVCLDADTTVETDYLVRISAHFRENPDTPGCSLSFEHPTEGNGFDYDIYEGVVRYELHLRYYRNAMKFCGVPYGYHTVGSAMAVRSGAYIRCGGMNRRKAGEDFYFLHKIIAFGNFTELTATKVHPSPRSSDRVPFGTGKAISRWLKGTKAGYETYAFACFVAIRQFVCDLSEIHQTEKYLSKNDGVRDFLELENFDRVIAEIRSNTRDFISFRKRFFHWFDAFRFLKMVHFLRKRSGGGDELLTACSKLIQGSGPLDGVPNYRDMLLYFRNLDNNFSDSETFWSQRVHTV